MTPLGGHLAGRLALGGLLPRIGAVAEQQVHDFPIAVKRRLVQRRDAAALRSAPRASRSPTSFVLWRAAAACSGVTRWLLRDAALTSAPLSINMPAISSWPKNTARPRA